MTAHIAIARGTREVEGRTGPRAAFDFYMSQGIPTARATQAEIRSAGNKKAQFAAYCAQFGDQFGPVNGNGAVRSNEQVEDVVESGAIARVAEALGVSAKALAKLVNKPVEVTPEADEDEDAPIIATRISWPMCMAVKKIVEGQKLSFEITGKTGGKDTGKLADYAIKVAGRKVTPAQASALIAADRA